MTDAKGLDPNYAYTRPQLREVPRFFLQAYLEQRYNIPRAKSKAPPNYDGVLTATIKEEESLIELIWEKYQEEGIAGKKTLLKGAPRPPAEGKEPEELEVDDKKEKPKRAPEPEKTKPPKQAKPKEEKPAAEFEPPGRSQAVLKAVLKAIQEHMAPVFEYHELATNERKAIFDEVEAGNTMVESLGIEVDRLREGLRSILVLVSSLFGDIRGEDFGIDDETIQKAFQVGWEVTEPLGETGHETEEEVEEAEEEAEKTTEAKVSTVTYEEGAAYNVEIGGKMHTVSMTNLQDESVFDSSLLGQLAAELGLEARGVPRVRIIPLIWDEIVTQCNA